MCLPTPPEIKSNTRKRVSDLYMTHRSLEMTFYKLAGRRPAMTQPHCEGVLERKHIGA